MLKYRRFGNVTNSIRQRFISIHTSYSVCEHALSSTRNNSFSRTTISIQPSSIRIFSSMGDAKVKQKYIEQMEQDANSYPTNPTKQYLYLKTIVNEDPMFVIRRVETGKFAVNSMVIEVYEEALRLIGQPKLDQSDSSNTGNTGLTRLYNYLNGALMITYTCCGVALLYIMYNLYKGGGSRDNISGIIGDVDYAAKIPSETFEDVAGYSAAKKEMKNLVKFLSEPEKFTKMGCKIPKGFLLSGPPGVGKTLLARALAGEANVPIFYASGSQFDEIFVGLGPKRVRKLFESAKKMAPSIIFIDEIDTIGQSRQSSYVGSRGTLNQLLAEMDGFDEKQGVIVLAATNDPDSLDEALVREGRFDGKITLHKPCAKNRYEILKVHTRNKILHEDCNIKNLAKACTDMSGAQLATMVNIAGIRAVQNNQTCIHQDDLEFARAKVLLGGVDKSLMMSDEEQEMIACHEAGHAIMSLLREDLTNSDVYLATIEPRGFTLGHVSRVPNDDYFSVTNEQLLANIDIAFGGRAAEEIASNENKEKVTTGCSADMSNATRIAEMLVADFGYSDKIGYVRYSDSQLNNVGTNKIVQDEVRKLLDNRYQVTKSELLKHRAAWKRLTKFLLEYRTLTGEECRIIFNGGKPARSKFEGLPSS